jgi:hypothetical protein
MVSGYKSQAEVVLFHGVRDEGILENSVAAEMGQYHSGSNPDLAFSRPHYLRKTIIFSWVISCIVAGMPPVP